MSRPPIVLVHGTRFVRARPGIRIELVPGAGHLATFDAPAAVTDAIRRFARELSPAS